VRGFENAERGGRTINRGCTFIGGKVLAVFCDLGDLRWGVNPDRPGVEVFCWGGGRILSCVGVQNAPLPYSQ